MNKEEKTPLFSLSSLYQPNALLLVDVRDVRLVRLLDDDLIESVLFDFVYASEIK